MESGIYGSAVGISDNRQKRLHSTTLRQLTLVSVFLGLSLLLFSGCDSESMFTGSSSRTDKALRILDPSSAMLVHIDVQSGITTLEEILPGGGENQAKMDEATAELAEILGINPRKDIHHLYFSMSGIGAEADGGLVAFMDFDQNEMNSKLASVEDLTKVESAGKTDTYRMEGESGMQFSLVDGTMVLMSNHSDHLGRMVSRSSDADLSSRTGDALFEKVQKMENWIIVRDVNLLMPEMNYADTDGEAKQAAMALKAVKSLGAGLNTKGNLLDGALFIQPNDDVEAKDLASVISGLRAAARVQLEDQPELKDRLEDVDISAKNGLVQITMEMDKAEISSLFESMKSQADSM